jgi:hypothetical protein
MPLLLTNAQRARLLANGRTNATLTAAGRRERDFPPVVKLFTRHTGVAVRRCQQDALRA